MTVQIVLWHMTLLTRMTVIFLCEYMQQEPDRIENLAISETRKFEHERKARSSTHQAQQPIVTWGRGMQRRIQTPSTIAQGSAWQVETRASTRRQQEQAR
jgi:hypothetical protein